MGPPQINQASIPIVPGVLSHHQNFSLFTVFDFPACPLRCATLRRERHACC